jgi:hypothetical protein
LAKSSPLQGGLFSSAQLSGFWRGCSQMLHKPQFVYGLCQKQTIRPAAVAYYHAISAKSLSRKRLPMRKTMI